MSADRIFSICNMIAIMGWIVLVFFPMWKSRDRYVTGTIAILFSIIYTSIMARSFEPGIFESFGTLTGVADLFQNKFLLVAGWVHYLAFDLFVGSWIVRNARQHNINHWLTVPALLLTFMLGPVGYLVYFIMRWIKTKTFIAQDI
ncbi:MAG: DUF4281 domain-containing protein [Chitinophagaceae bacterium]|nr:DUF4281 domain-containing protein [Chitinophagaceae bacterium]